MRANDLGQRRALAGGVALSVMLAALTTPAFASAVFTNGTFALPEGIVPAPGGGFLVSDADNDNISLIPATGGATTTSQAEGFRVFGEVSLTSYYGANSGDYLAYGQTSDASSGILALVGSSGIGAPNIVVNSGSNDFYSGAIVAPTAFGSIPGNAVVLGNQYSSEIDVLNPSATSTTTFASLPGVDVFGVGFAPSTFGADAGDLFVSDGVTGNLYVVNAQGQSSLFATLPLPSGFNQPGLRQFAWAPAGFGAYGGDLFISVAAQNGGGGTNGDVEILNAQGQIVGGYAQGNGAVPLDPRGLDFVNSSELLVANADPSIAEVVPSDFVPASILFNVPEPASAVVLLAGLASLTGLRLGRFRERAGR